jgi:hypothetical protein
MIFKIKRELHYILCGYPALLFWFLLLIDHFSAAGDSEAMPLAAHGCLECSFRAIVRLGRRQGEKVNAC